LGDRNVIDGEDNIWSRRCRHQCRAGNSLDRIVAVFVSAGKPIDFPRCCLLVVQYETRVRVPDCQSSWLRLPYDLARVGRAEPYLAYVAVIAEVVEFLRVHVLPAAARANNRGSEKRRVMHNGCCAVTVCITYNSRVPSSDDVNSSPVRSVIIPLWFVQV